MGSIRQAVKAATPREAEFIRMGYEVGSLDFLIKTHDAATFRACVQATGGYNRFDAEEVASVLGGMFGDFMSMDIGRESSPVIYVHMAFWTHQKAGSKAGAGPLGLDEISVKAEQAQAAGAQLLADEIDAQQSPVLASVSTVRLWWD